MGPLDVMRHKVEVLRAALRRRSGATRRRDRVHARLKADDPRLRGRGRPGLAGAMAHNRTPMAEVEDDDTFWNGTAEQIAEKLAPYVELGFRTVISEQPAPYDMETFERLIGEVKPLVDADELRPRRAPPWPSRPGQARAVLGGLRHVGGGDGRGRDIDARRRRRPDRAVRRRRRGRRSTAAAATAARPPVPGDPVHAGRPGARLHLRTRPAAARAGRASVRVEAATADAAAVDVDAGATAALHQLLRIVRDGRSSSAGVGPEPDMPGFMRR